MDKRKDIARFLGYINGYMSKLCPETFNVLKDIPYYWLLMSRKDLSTMANLFQYQKMPDLFVGTKYLKENMLNIFLKEINSDRRNDDYDVFHELSELQKEAISAAICSDVQNQDLNIDNVFATGNPYLVLYNTHP